MVLQNFLLIFEWDLSWACFPFCSFKLILSLFKFRSALSFSGNYKNDFQWQAGSICALTAWLSLALYIDKLPVFGIYAVMFRRILFNSLKILPLFLIMLYGFSLSSSIQHHNVINDFNSTTTSMVLTLAQVVGELGVDSLGIGQSFVKQLVFFMFVGLMCIIILNLLIGISIGEIRSVIEQADTRLIVEKIKYTLAVQESFYKYWADDGWFVYEAARKDYEVYVRAKERLRQVFMLREGRERVEREADGERGRGLEQRLARVESDLKAVRRLLERGVA